ncbi:MAG: deoxyribodipyrimidine photo-lyase [Candidatus Bathyarchaeota archaeon]|nr:deoxyribodipyrimidine photo-lyase [Candidatus Bathyarchaeota archaeon]
MRVLYWFRRDLRVRDNRALAEAVSRSNKVVAVFIFDADTLREREIDFKDPRFIFLLDALRELEAKVRLHVFCGRTCEVFEHLLGRYRFNAIYTASPLSWDEEIKVQEVRKICQKNNVKFIEVIDNVLVDSSSIGSVNNFAIFYRRWRKLVDAQTIGEVSPKSFAEIDEPNLTDLSAKNR